jgi:hypothetical protein
MALEQTTPQSLITSTKDAVDGFNTILSAAGYLPTMVAGLTKLSSSLGVAGALVGLVFPLLGVTSPDV